ncbi:hypothetical protein BFP72_14760 [Reichenbachiella sp. 5M10]|uniref:ATP-binding protein n=1 Tax=Reichenbachiella sp. 5M10 TaxID=1889772 RepID=UPI000C14EF01|nr:ATP-binding protein [Reichenbachiella sp. 5M10]PIB36571.1 hypothetical protein BFP72_14760 [Reichenbachiella sp. 5M10]
MPLNISTFTFLFHGSIPVVWVPHSTAVLESLSAGLLALVPQIPEIPFEYEQTSGGQSDLLFTILGLLTCLGFYIFMKMLGKQVGKQKYVLEKRANTSRSELIEQKERYQKQSEELQKANEEIQIKNSAIEEAFAHLSNSYAKMADLNREKDGLMRVVAHDLRTPLNNIEGLIQLVSMDDNLNDDQKDYISKIRGVVKHGNEMIRDLLDISHSKDFKPNLKITTFTMLDFLSSWKINFENSLLTKKQTLRISGSYKTLTLQSDMGLLSRVLDNLMSNAMKFSESGKSIYLNITPVEDKARITLRDEGPGISPSDQQKMFKPFTRLSARPTNGEPSNGLGLSIIKSLTEQLGGTITVHSTLGEGTTFEVTIPLLAPQ